jgi:hypothetical protein
MAIEATLRSDHYDAGEDCTLEITARRDDTLTSSDTVEWQLPHSWTEEYGGASYTKELQTTDPNGAHYVPVSAADATFELDIEQRHLPDTDMETRHGRHIVASIQSGEIQPGEPVQLRFANTTAPNVAGSEPIWIALARESPAEPVTVTTTGGAAETVRIIAPSAVSPGETFQALIVSLDEYENRSSTAYADRLLSTVDGTELVDGLSFTGSTRTTVALDDQGIRRLKFGETVSNPIRVAPDTSGPYWGDIHVHTGLSHDGQGHSPYQYARDVAGLDFAATAEHIESLGQEGNRISLDRTAEANAPGSFVTIPAYETSLPKSHSGGHYNLYFRSEDGYRDWLESTANLDMTGGVDDDDINLILEDAFDDRIDPSDVMVVPHHTGIGFGQCHPEHLADSERAPIIEVYSHHGQSEYYAPQHALSYEFNRFRHPERRSPNSVKGRHYAQDFWEAGHRMGVMSTFDRIR